MPPAVKWSKASKKRLICSRAMWHGTIKKHERPTYLDTSKTLIYSPNGKEWLKGRIAAIKDTAVDVGFSEAIRNVGLGERFGGLLRNGDERSKHKVHPDAIDFQMGEQNDGGANELRGAVAKKDGTQAWQPPDHLLLTKDWTISDERIFDLIEAALHPDADGKAGPLAEAQNKRKKTSSTGNGRAATFVVDYLIALVSAADSVA